jgi:hypothetical protein
VGVRKLGAERHSAWAFGFLVGALLLPAGMAGAGVGDPEARFREATSLARAADYPGAIAVYRGLAAAGHESASLYWNWAQAAEARGSAGEAMWALLRAREVEPSDAVLSREIERLRMTMNLDPAELSPTPLAGAARLLRRPVFGLAAVALLLLSLAGHSTARLARGRRGRGLSTAWVVSGLVGLGLGAAVLLAGMARPMAVVSRRGVSLGDAASPTANVLATLREAEVVPVLETSGPYLRVQDSSGARGWVLEEDVRLLDRPLPAQ